MRFLLSFLFVLFAFGCGDREEKQQVYIKTIDCNSESQCQEKKCCGNKCNGGNTWVVVNSDSKAESSSNAYAKNTNVNNGGGYYPGSVPPPPPPTFPHPPHEDEDNTNINNNVNNNTNNNTNANTNWNKCNRRYRFHDDYVEKVFVCGNRECRRTGEWKYASPNMNEIYIDFDDNKCDRSTMEYLRMQ